MNTDNDLCEIQSFEESPNMVSHQELISYVDQTLAEMGEREKVE